MPYRYSKYKVWIRHQHPVPYLWPIPKCRRSRLFNTSTSGSLENDPSHMLPICENFSNTQDICLDFRLPQILGELSEPGTDHMWLPGTEFEGLWHNSEIVGPGCHRQVSHAMVTATAAISGCFRFPNGTMITGVFENHGATGEAGHSGLRN